MTPRTERTPAFIPQAHPIFQRQIKDQSCLDGLRERIRIIFQQAEVDRRLRSIKLWPVEAGLIDGCGTQQAVSSGVDRRVSLFEDTEHPGQKIDELENELRQKYPGLDETEFKLVLFESLLWEENLCCQRIGAVWSAIFHSPKPGWEGEIGKIASKALHFAVQMGLPGDFKMAILFLKKASPSFDDQMREVLISRFTDHWSTLSEYHRKYFVEALQDEARSNQDPIFSQLRDALNIQFELEASRLDAALHQLSSTYSGPTCMWSKVLERISALVAGDIKVDAWEAWLNKSQSLQRNRGYATCWLMAVRLLRYLEPRYAVDFFAGDAFRQILASGLLGEDEFRSFFNVVLKAARASDQDTEKVKSTYKRYLAVYPALNDDADKKMIAKLKKRRTTAEELGEVVQYLKNGNPSNMEVWSMAIDKIASSSDTAMKRSVWALWQEVGNSNSDEGPHLDVWRCAIRLLGNEDSKEATAFYMSSVFQGLLAAYPKDHHNFVPFYSRVFQLASFSGESALQLIEAHQRFVETYPSCMNALNIDTVIAIAQACIRLGHSARAYELLALCAKKHAGEPMVIKKLQPFVLEYMPNSKEVLPLVEALFSLEGESEEVLDHLKIATTLIRDADKKDIAFECAFKGLMVWARKRKQVKQTYTEHDYKKIDEYMAFLRIALNGASSETVRRWTKHPEMDNFRNLCFLVPKSRWLKSDGIHFWKEACLKVLDEKEDIEGAIQLVCAGWKITKVSELTEVIGNRVIDLALSILPKNEVKPTIETANSFYKVLTILNATFSQDSSTKMIDGKRVEVQRLIDTLFDRVLEAGKGPIATASICLSQLLTMALDPAISNSHMNGNAKKSIEFAVNLFSRKDIVGSEHFVFKSVLLLREPRLQHLWGEVYRAHPEETYALLRYFVDYHFIIATAIIEHSHDENSANEKEIVQKAFQAIIIARLVIGLDFLPLEKRKQIWACTFDHVNSISDYISKDNYARMLRELLYLMVQVLSSSADSGGKIPYADVENSLSIFETGMNTIQQKLINEAELDQPYPYLLQILKDFFFTAVNFQLNCRHCPVERKKLLFDRALRAVADIELSNFHLLQLMQLAKSAHVEFPQRFFNSMNEQKNRFEISLNNPTLAAERDKAYRETDGAGVTFMLALLSQIALENLGNSFYVSALNLSVRMTKILTFEEFRNRDSYKEMFRYFKIVLDFIVAPRAADMMMSPFLEHFFFALSHIRRPNSNLEERTGWKPIATLAEFIGTNNNADIHFAQKWIEDVIKQILALFILSKAKEPRFTIEHQWKCLGHMESFLDNCSRTGYLSPASIEEYKMQIAALKTR